MSTEGSDDLVAFPDVRVIRSTAPALLCRVHGKLVWLPRGHITGRLCCVGDRGRLLIRRWVARDRQLIGPAGFVGESPAGRALRRLSRALHALPPHAEPSGSPFMSPRALNAPAPCR
jgi:hypothetical protein